MNTTRPDQSHKAEPTRPGEKGSRRTTGAIPWRTDGGLLIDDAEKVDSKDRIEGGEKGTLPPVA